MCAQRSCDFMDHHGTRSENVSNMKLRDHVKHLAHTVAVDHALEHAPVALNLRLCQTQVHSSQ
jgi:hypothetical protein